MLNVTRVVLSVQDVSLEDGHCISEKHLAKG